MTDRAVTTNRSRELLLRVAWYYYKDQLTQEEIAGRLNVSRASVGRMLERARQESLVSINLNVDGLTSFELSDQLRDRFSLREAVVIPGSEEVDQLTVNSRLGIAGAEYVSGRVPADAGIGVGWGDTVSRVFGGVDRAVLSRLHMVTLTGGVNGYLQALSYFSDNPEQIPVSVIPTPILASSPEFAAALKAEPEIREVLESARNLQYAVVGVGTPGPHSTLVQLGYLSAKQAGQLAKSGVVGDVLGVFFDEAGKEADLPLHHRRIGIGLDDLRKVDCVIGVAGGGGKVTAIAGALRAKTLDVLITDERTATGLLALDAGQP